METFNTTTTNTTGGIARAWEAIVTFVPNFLGFLIILVAGYFVSTFLGKLVGQVLGRIGFDRAVERSGIKKVIEGTGYHPSQILGKIAFYTAFLFVLELAFGVFGPNPISDLLTRMIAFLPNVFVAVVIAVLSASIAAAAKDIIRATLGGLSYGRMLSNVAAGAIILVGAFAALNQLSIAPEIVNGLFYAILAIVVGVTVVAVGGAGIAPMRGRWENALNALEQEAPRMKDHLQNRSEAGVPVTTNPNGPTLL